MVDRPEWMTDRGFATIERGYLLPDETPRDMYRRLAKSAAQYVGAKYEDKFFDYMWKGWLCPASPVLSNLGSPRGLPISCLTGDMWVMTKNDGGKQIADLKVGDQVLTHKGRYREVTNKTSRSSSGELYRLKVRTCPTPIKITGNHPVLTNRGWVRVDELDPSQHLIARTQKIEYVPQDVTLDLGKFEDSAAVQAGMVQRVAYAAEHPRFVQIDDEIAWFIGYWLAEGSITIDPKKEPNGIRVTANRNERDFLERFLDIAKRRFNCNGSIYESKVFRKGKDNHWITANVNSVVLGQFFMLTFGRHAKTKNIPENLKILPANLLRIMFDAVYDGDGKKSGQSRYITLANPKLVLSLFEIGVKCGLNCGLQMQEKASKLATTKHVYRVSVIDYDRNTRTTTNKSATNTGVLFYDGLRYCPFWLDKIDGDAEVYDITVAEDHSFSVAGVIVHNCFGVSASDSVDSIFSKVHEQAMLAKHGGGVGIDISKIRCRNTPITGNGVSEGVVPWAKVYDATTVAVSQGCYDDQTEILTESGWQLFSALNRSSRVAQVDANEQVTFVHPSDYIRYKVDEDLNYFSFRDGTVDLMVTDNHSMVIRRKRRVTNVRNSEGKFVNHSRILGGLEFSRADEVKYHRDTVHIAAVSVSGERQSLTPFERVLIAFQADGTTKPTGNSNGKVSGTLKYCFHFSKDRKITRLKKLLTDAGLYFTVNKQTNRTCNFLVDFPLDSLPTKKFSDWVDLTKIDSAWCLEFLAELKNWDGSRGGSKMSGTYCTTESENADIVQAVATLCQSKSKVRRIDRPAPRQSIYLVYWTVGRKYVGGENFIRTKVPYSGEVFCVEVPEHRIIVRRNGVVSVCGNSVRRGASSLNLPVTHGDIREFLRIRKPEGDHNRQCLNSHQCVMIPDEFMVEVRDGNPDARALWLELMRTRLETGEPYLMFSDTVNRANPQNHPPVTFTNICSEINLHADADHTFVCCLSSLNVAKYDEWKDTDLVETSILFLDAVMSEFIERATVIPGFECAVRFSEKSRALGLGVLGWHTLLQQRSLPFDDPEAMRLNAQVFKLVGDQAKAASRKLGAELGSPVWAPDGQRNSHVTAIAPTATNSIIAGDVSPGIEPNRANVISLKTAKGTFIVKNHLLQQKLQELGKDTSEVWASIAQNDGSVYHLSFLDDHTKHVFATAPEINQLALIRQAAQRQQFICQSQSLNLFFPANVDPKFFNKVHLEAWESGVKTLYYVRSSSVLRADVAKRALSEDCIACEG